MRIIKSLIRILLLLGFIYGFLIYGLHLFVNIKGKQLLTKKLQEVFQRKVRVKVVKTRLPFDLVIKGLEVKNLFKVDEIVAVGGVADLLRGNIIVPELKIRGALVSIVKSRPPESEEKSPEAPSGEEIAAPANATVQPQPEPAAKITFAPENFNLPLITVKHVVITDSIFNFVDHSVAEQAIQLTLKDVNINIERLSFPVFASEVTSFELTGKIPWQNIQEEGKIWVQGWVNLYKKDMRAEIKIQDIDAIHLHPYYASWVDLEKSRIQKAKLNFFSEVTGLNNEVNADCHLELSSIVFKPREEDQPQERAEKLAEAVIDIFKALNEGKVVLDFKFKTKMDSPEFGLNKIIRTAVKHKISEARKGESGTLPTKIITGTISGATDLTKALINGTMSIGAELRKAFESSFSRESKAPTNQTQ